jgi:small-conductance mechanosensitive channel
MSNQLVNLDFLNKEAEIYKQNKSHLQSLSKNMQDTLVNNTKQEMDEVQQAINRLNQKIETLMNSDEIKGQKQAIESCHKRMSLSIDLAAKTFFKIRNLIYEKKNLDIEKKKEYEKKVYEKIISKFLTKEEIEEFERLINNNSIVIVPSRHNNLIDMK